jgi:hypothetical protein
MVTEVGECSSCVLRSISYTKCKHKPGYGAL